MNITREQLLLYAITDRSWLKGETLYAQVEKALKGGVTLVQLREKELSEPEFEAEGRSLLELCHRYRVPLIINDNVELAERIGADGVHVGQSDMELTRAREILGTVKIIGVTAKTIEQAQAAEKAGADYLGSGAVFGSSTKTDAKPMELTLLQEICQSVTIPVVAIGGINHEYLLFATVLSFPLRCPHMRRFHLQLLLLQFRILLILYKVQMMILVNKGFGLF